MTDKLVEAIEAGYDLIVVNYANPDMVGHTGILAAAIAACEAVDRGLGRALAALEEAGGAMIVTADHGNCETMVDPVTGGPHTSHTTNPVPVVLVGGPAGAKLRDGRLADLAPTLLDLMGLPQPPEMTGQSLIWPMSRRAGPVPCAGRPAGRGVRPPSGEPSRAQALARAGRRRPRRWRGAGRAGPGRGADRDDPRL